MVQRLHKGFICPVFLTLVASGAFHAPAHGADVILEEVVVTARKRGAESIQDIGGSIQVLFHEHTVVPVVQPPLTSLVAHSLVVTDHFG